MKKCKCSIFLVVFLLLCFFEVRVVEAKEYQGYIYQDEKIDRIYFYKHRSDTNTVKYETHNFHEQATIYRRSSDNDYVYCIENWAKLTGAGIGDYVQKDLNDSSNRLNKEQLLEIEAIGYFGYGYKDNNYDHTSKKWYAITQYLIWQVESPHIETYFVDSITSTNPLNIFEDEIKEIKTLVNKVKTFPTFSEDSLKHTIYDNLHLVDETNSLSFPNTKVTTEMVSRISIKDKNLNIKPLNKGLLSGGLLISREGNRFSRESTIYESNSYQNAISIGDYSLRSKKYMIEDKSVLLQFDVTCQKLYSFSKKFNFVCVACNNQVAPLIISEEDIYNNDHELLMKKGEKVELNKDYSINLYPAKYKVVVEETDKYHPKEEIFDLSDKLDQMVKADIRLEYQYSKITTTKKIENFFFIDNELIYDNTFGENIEFGLYANEDIDSEMTNNNLLKKDDLITTTLSDKYGNVTFSMKLPYGKYYIKELNNDLKYQENNELYYFDFYKDGSEAVQTIRLDDIYNYLNKGFINVRVIDEDTFIPLKTINIGIYNATDKLIYSGYTDDDGKVRLELPYGKYYIKQLNVLDEYKYSKEAIECELSSAEENIEIKNKRIKIDESGGITVPNIPKDDEEIIVTPPKDEEEITTNPPKEDDVVIEDGNIDIDNSDGFIVDVPSTLDNDYALIVLVTLLSGILLLLRYAKKD